MPLRKLTVRGVEIVESYDGRNRSDHSTRFVAAHLRVRPGDCVAEVGCGTGVLATLAAKLGADRVWATDVAASAVDRARETAAASGATTVRVAEGPLLDPVPADEPIDLVVAVMPQKPTTVELSRRYAGGTDGADLLVSLIGAAAERLRNGGRVVLYHHTAAAPARVEHAFARRFAWRVVAERTRCISAALYGGLAPGMFAHALDLAARGVIDVRVRGPYVVWRARVIEGVRR